MFFLVKLENIFSYGKDKSHVKGCRKKGLPRIQMLAKINSEGFTTPCLLLGI